MLGFRNRKFNNPTESYIFLGIWVFISLFSYYAHHREKPHFFRFLNQLAIVRNIIPLFNLSDRESFKDLSYVIQFSSFQNRGLNLMQLCSCYTEKYYVHLPLSLVYQFMVALGEQSIFYQIKEENAVKFILKNKLGVVLQ